MQILSHKINLIVKALDAEACISSAKDAVYMAIGE